MNANNQSFGCTPAVENLTEAILSTGILFSPILFIASSWHHPLIRSAIMIVNVNVMKYYFTRCAFP